MTTHFAQALRLLGTTKQASEQLKVTDRTVANWQRGRLPLAIKTLIASPELALAVLVDSIAENPQSPTAKYFSLPVLYQILQMDVTNSEHTTEDSNCDTSMAA